MKNKVFAALGFAIAATSANAFIAFTGFNADGTDGYSFVALQDIAAGTVIGFTDEEWNGTGWIANTESQWTWTATDAVFAGTVVALTNMNALYSGNPVETTGVIAGVSDSTNNAGFGNSDESIYAYTGAHASPTIIAAITTETGANLAGLANGYAVTLAADTDGAKYTGPRTGKNSFAEYLPLLGDVATNWTDEGTNGTDNFDTTKFEINPVPEPSSMLALGLGAVALLRRKK